MYGAINMFLRGGPYRSMENSRLNISKNIINIQSNTPHKTKIKTLKEVDNFLAQNKILKTNNLNEANSIMYGPGFCHHTHPSIILKKSNIFPLKTIKFEGCDYPCPNNIGDFHKINACKF